MMAHPSSPPTVRSRLEGRVDVRLRLTAPVEVERPIGDPVAATTISFAVDDPASLLRELERCRASPEPERGESAGRPLGLLAPADLLGAATA